MKLILYKNMEIVRVIDNISGVEIEQNSICWNNGKLNGIKVDFVLVDDDVELDLEIAIPLDRKNEFKKVDLVKENEMNAIAVMELTNIVLGGY